MAAFLDDPDVAQRLRNTMRPDEVVPGDYDAIMFVGGHSPMFDFPDNSSLQAIARVLWENG